MDENQTFFRISALSILVCIIVSLLSPPAFSNEQPAKKEVITRCEELSGFQRSLCMEIKEKRASLINATARAPQGTYSGADRQRQKPFRNPANLVSSYKGKAELICKVPLTTSKVSYAICTRTATLISHLSEEGARIAINDLNLITDKLKLIERAIAKCGNGRWISVSAGSGILIEDGALTDNLVAELTKGCGSFGQGGGGAGGSQPGSGAGSGLSGIDDFNPFCGLPNINVANFAGNALNHLEKTRKQCQETLIDMVKEGGTSDPTDPNTQGTSDPVKVDKDKIVTTVDNDDGTVTVCSENGCYVRYKKTGDVMTAEASKKEGTTTTTVTNYGMDSNGEANARKTIYNSKGKGKWTDYFWDQESGKWYRTGRGTNKDYGKRHQPELVPIPHNCDAVEACSSCENFLENSAAVAEDCRMAGGGLAISGLCAEYGNAMSSSCCDSKKGAQPDPTVLYPNPEGGGITCSGISIDKKKEICSMQCSVASSETDCNRECMSTSVNTFSFRWLDHVCQRMISEKCFSGRGMSLPDRLVRRPGRQGPQPPPPPNRSPYFAF